jgi:2-keto-4-pentenoate hydratase/2-oxohepta-3-ene-1,7-dioic acid hydratase in catechol pathway
VRLFLATDDAGSKLGVVLTDGRTVLLNTPDSAESPVLAVLRGGEAAIGDVRAAAEEAASDPDNLVEIANLKLGPVLPDPGKILCVGFNYLLHANEMSVELPAAPNVFTKFQNSLIGPDDAIELPNVSDQIDYEGELVAVIGRRCFEVSEDDALSYVAGYTIMNDVSARDLQFRTTQWTLGKALDTFAPLGPVLTLTDEIPDPQALHLTTKVDDEVVQDASTAQMLFGVASIVSTISQSMTLEPGDIIATGTPDGVGYKRNPPLYLKDGHVVSVTVDKIGTLSNPVLRLTAAAAR